MLRVRLQEQQQALRQVRVMAKISVALLLVDCLRLQLAGALAHGGYGPAGKERSGRASWAHKRLVDCARLAPNGCRGRCVIENATGNPWIICEMCTKNTAHSYGGSVEPFVVNRVTNYRNKMSLIATQNRSTRPALHSA